MDRIYCGPPPPPTELWASWNLDPVVLAALVGLTVLLRREPAGLAAVAVIFVAVVSPLCALSSLFSARVAHHVLLVAVAAPLLAAALPARRPGAAALPFVISTAVLWI